MSEPVFFPPAARISLADIVACTGAAVTDGADLSVIISGGAPLDEAGPGELTFLDCPENAVLLETSRASRLLRHAGRCATRAESDVGSGHGRALSGLRARLATDVSARRSGQNPCLARRESIPVPRSIPRHGLNKA